MAIAGAAVSGETSSKGGSEFTAKKKVTAPETVARQTEPNLPYMFADAHIHQEEIHLFNQITKLLGLLAREKRPLTDGGVSEILKKKLESRRTAFRTYYDSLGQDPANHDKNEMNYAGNVLQAIDSLQAATTSQALQEAAAKVLTDFWGENNRSNWNPAGKSEQAPAPTKSVSETGRSNQEEKQQEKQAPRDEKRSTGEKPKEQQPASPEQLLHKELEANTQEFVSLQQQGADLLQEMYRLNFNVEIGEDEDPNAVREQGRQQAEQYIAALQEGINLLDALAKRTRELASKVPKKKNGEYFNKAREIADVKRHWENRVEGVRYRAEHGLDSAADYIQATQHATLEGDLNFLQKLVLDMENHADLKNEHRANALRSYRELHALERKGQETSFSRLRESLLNAEPFSDTDERLSTRDNLAIGVRGWENYHGLVKATDPVIAEAEPLRLDALEVLIKGTEFTLMDVFDYDTLADHWAELEKELSAEWMNAIFEQLEPIMNDTNGWPLIDADKLPLVEKVFIRLISVIEQSAAEQRAEEAYQKALEEARRQDALIRPPLIDTTALRATVSKFSLGLVSPPEVKPVLSPEERVQKPELVIIPDGPLRSKATQLLNHFRTRQPDELTVLDVQALTSEKLVPGPFSRQHVSQSEEGENAEAAAA